MKMMSLMAIVSVVNCGNHIGKITRPPSPAAPALNSGPGSRFIRGLLVFGLIRRILLHQMHLVPGYEYQHRHVVQYLRPFSYLQVECGVLIEYSGQAPR